MPRRDDMIEYDDIPLNKRGVSIFSRKKAAKITNLDDLNASELAYARMYSATLKAVGYSWRKISDTLNIQTSLIKAWADDTEWTALVHAVAQDIVTGAATHLQQQQIELVEMLLDMARRTTDSAVRLRAIESALDRGGLSKVNKSESIVTKNERHAHELGDDFFSKLEGLPIETQKRVAEMAIEMETLVSDAKGTE